MVRTTQAHSTYLLLATLACVTAFAGCAAPKQQTSQSQVKQFAFWPVAPNPPRIQFLTAFNSSKDLAGTQSNMEKMLYGDEPVQTLDINKPYGVRLWNGRLYLCDVRGTGIVVLDLRANQTRLIGATGSGVIKKAVDVAVTPQGMIYVLDPVQRAVLVFGPDERFTTAFPLGTDCQPVGLAVLGPNLYVSDIKNSRVMILDSSNGKLRKTFGQRGGEDGEFVGPLAIAIDKTGNVYVSDTIRARVQKFTYDGRFIMGFGEAGDRPGNFVRPKHLGIDQDDHIHVVDAAFNNVQVFDPEGRVVGYYGGPGRHPGAMNLPAGLDINSSDLDIFAKFVHPAFDAKQLIIVSNQFGNQKIAVYAMGQLKPDKTVMDIAANRANVEGGIATTQATTMPATSPAGTDFTPRP